MRIAGIEPESLVDGPGIRFVVFAQGCKHHCSGCHNPDTWDLQGGKEVAKEDLLKQILDAFEENPILDGVTFSGGDPFEQADDFSWLAAQLKEKDINVWCYTGYTYKELLNHTHIFKQMLLDFVDVLVDGKFKEKKAVPGLKFRGSNNQRFVNPKTGKDINLDQ